MRDMRNAFVLDALEAWDYPENSELQAAILNQAFVATDRPVEILQHVKNDAQPYLGRTHE